MKKTIVIILVVIMILQMFSISGVALNIKKDDVSIYDTLQNFVSGEIIVKFKPGIEDKIISSIHSKYGINIVYTSKFAGIQRLKIPAGKTVSEMVEVYKNNPDVEYVEPNYIAHACMVPNDPYYGYQWNFHGVDEGGIDMEPAWDVSTGVGCVVAVIDTGIRVGSDLSDTCFVSGYDFVNDDNDPIDDNGHGTHVAGTVAQSTNDNNGVAGVAFDACLMPVKVLDSQGSGYYSDIVDGIYYAVDNGANIISMSLEGSSSSQALEDALAYAYNNDVTCIAASGNSGQNGVAYPAAYDNYVIAVGATQYDKTRTSYSNYGASLDVVAPGGNVDVDQNNDGYGDGVLQQTFTKQWWWIRWGYYFYQGTSMATPHVSGVAALLFSMGITSPDEIRNILQSTAIDLGESGWDIYYGHGLINAYAAVQAVGGGDPPIADAGTDQTADEGDAINFDGSGSYDPDGTIVSYEWDFGDGTSGSGINPTNVYIDNDVYTVTLTVTDNEGYTDDDTTTITVNNVAPTANANGPYNGDEGQTITFTGSATDPGTSDTHTYHWDLGDGATSTQQNPTHTYTQDNVYTVILTVEDNDGGSDTDTTLASISDKDPAADFSYLPENPTSGDTVQFNDESTSYDGTISWSWNFDDGATSSMQNPSHIFSSGGDYTVSLTIGESDGDTDTSTQIITVYEEQSPVANAGVDQTADEGDTINFDGSGSYDPDGTIISYEWDFGDGNTGNGVNPTHTYIDNGIYTSTLTVTDDQGLTDDDTVTVTINNVAPTANANGPYAGDVGEEITFTGGVTDPGDDTFTYHWDFGDGTTKAGQTVTHAYTTDGEYTVTLTVTDDDGDSDTDTTTATINPTSNPTMHVKSIDMGTQSKYWGWQKRAKATVTVVDVDNNPLQGATVYGHWSGLTSESDTGTTNSQGKITEYSNWLWFASGTFTFTVNNIEKSGWTYDSSANVETSDSISV